MNNKRLYIVKPTFFFLSLCATDASSLQSSFHISKNQYKTNNLKAIQHYFGLHIAKQNK